MQIKRITSNETEWVTDLFDKYRMFYKQPSDPALAEKFIKERLTNNESVIFAALDERENKIIPAGFMQLYPAYSSVRAVKNWILNDLYVDSAYRKQGIGEQLIKAAMHFAKENNAASLQLETAADNYTAQRLYEAIGFTKQQPDSDFYVYKIDVTK